jgi:hypothetical protein
VSAAAVKSSTEQKLSEELRVGDMVWFACRAHRIVEKRDYLVPASILIESEAAKNPEGIPSWILVCDTGLDCTAMPGDAWEVVS